MPEIFISYRRLDSAAIAGRIYDHLASEFSKDCVFIDSYSIHPGDDFRDVIRKRVVMCDVLLVIIGPDWLTLTGRSGQRRLDEPGDWVRLEVEAGLQSKTTTVIPIWVSEASTLTLEALPQSIHELAFRNGITIGNGSDFDRDIDYLINFLRTLETELTSPSMAQPSLSGSNQKPLLEADMPVYTEQEDVIEASANVSSRLIRVEVLVALIAGIFSLFVAVVGILPDLLSQQPTPTSVPVILISTNVPQLANPNVSQATDTPTDYLTVTAYAQATQDTQATSIALTVTAQSAQLATNIPTNITHLAPMPIPTLVPTNTPTPIPTNTATSTPSLTLTSTSTPTASPNLELTTSQMTHIFETARVTAMQSERNLQTTAVPTMSLLVVLQLAQAGVTHNIDWQVHPSDINGVNMVLVPTGCFNMGSNDGEDDERPVHRQCFYAPFWIDRTEVTRAMYEQCVAVEKCTAIPSNKFSEYATQPINGVTWVQAWDYCAWRGARLPTEREWEYAARGPDNLNYPWGNEWDGTKLIWSGNSNNITSDVGSKPEGKSWVGTLDMSGNVSEWVSTIYDQSLFPYREGKVGGESDSRDIRTHVFRGGSFLVTSSAQRAANRMADLPNAKFDFVGFRCASSINPESQFPSSDI